MLIRKVVLLTIIILSLLTLGADGCNSREQKWHCADSAKTCWPVDVEN